MKDGRTLLILMAIIFIVTGCGKYQLVESGHRVTVGECFRVDPEIPWSMTKEAGVFVWTVDGEVLERLIFFPGIEDGAPLVALRTGGGSPEMPAYKDSMSLLEVVDLLEATMARLEYHQFAKQNIRPTTIDGLDGFRVDFSFVSKQGLEYRGVAAGAKKNQKLYMVMYMGTALHYYDRYETVVDRIITGMELL